MTTKLRNSLRIATAAALGLTLALGVTSATASSAPDADRASVPNGSVTTKKLANGAVTTKKLHKGAVATKKLRMGAVTSAKIRNGHVRGPDLSAGVRTRASHWQTATAADDLLIDGTNLTHRILPAPSLTSKVIDSSQVSVYLRFTNRVWTLPYTSHAGGKPSTLDYFLEPGEIHITRFAHDNTSLAISSFLEYRYVITPGPQRIGTASRVQSPGAQSTTP